MSDLFSTDTSFPPALGGYPILALLVQIAFWSLMLILLQWIYSILDDKKQMPAHWRSYVGMTRNVKLGLLTAASFRTLPLLVLLVGWQKMGPVTRMVMAGLSYLIYVPVALLVAWAWWIDRAARAGEGGSFLAYRSMEFSRARAHEKTRSAVALFLIFVVAFAVTFIRVAPDNVPVPARIVDAR